VCGGSRVPWAHHHNHSTAIGTCLSFRLHGRRSVERTPLHSQEYVQGRTFSERMDNEWHRLVICYGITDPATTANPLGGKHITPSSLIGSWAGTTLVPDFLPFGPFVRSDQRQNLFNVSTRPYYVEKAQLLPPTACITFRRASHVPQLGH